MRRIQIKDLSLEAFSPYGTYADFYNPKSPKLGDENIEFYRDMILVDLGGRNNASISNCRILGRRPAAITATERHSYCSEGLMPIDGDIVIHVGPATPDGVIPAAEIEAFRIPKGTFVSIRPGIWHFGPFSLTGEPVNMLVVLPERTYVNDCKIYDIPEEDHIEIVGLP